MDKFPQFIALCGYPNSGKTTVQNIMRDRFKIQPVDDGAFLREAAQDWFKLSREDTHTQDGKERYSRICGKPWQNRDILGTLGNILEATFGDQVVPEVALNRLEVAPYGLYSFGSVRKNQGLTYKAAGGIVIEMRRPGCEPRYDFDHYDKSLVDFTIENDNVPDWNQRLIIAVDQIIGPISLKAEESYVSAMKHFDVV